MGRRTCMASPMVCASSTATRTRTFLKRTKKDSMRSIYYPRDKPLRGRWHGWCIATSFEIIQPVAQIDTKPPNPSSGATPPTTQNHQNLHLSGLLILKQQRRKMDQIVPPHHPRMPAGRLDLRNWHLLRLKPADQSTICRNQRIFGPASDPQKP